MTPLLTLEGCIKGGKCLLNNGHCKGGRHGEEESESKADGLIVGAASLDFSSDP